MRFGNAHEFKIICRSCGSFRKKTCVGAGSHSLVCSSWAVLVKEDELWKRLCAETWHTIPTKFPASMVNSNVYLVKSPRGKGIVWRDYYFTRLYMTAAIDLLVREGVTPAISSEVTPKYISHVLSHLEEAAQKILLKAVHTGMHDLNSTLESCAPEVFDLKIEALSLLARPPYTRAKDNSMQSLIASINQQLCVELPDFTLLESKAASELVLRIDKWTLRLFRIASRVFAADRVSLAFSVFSIVANILISQTSTYLRHSWKLVPSVSRQWPRQCALLYGFKWLVEQIEVAVTEDESIWRTEWDAPNNMKDKLPLIKTYLTSFPSGFGASRMFDVIKVVADNAFVKANDEGYDAKWARRYATLSAIALTATNGNGNIYESNLSLLWLDFIQKGLEDDREAVRYAALIASAELTLANSFHSLYSNFIPKIISIAYKADEQVRGLAVKALVNLCSNGSSADLTPWMDTFATAFAELLDRESNTIVLQFLLDGLGAFAGSSGTEFSRFSSTFATLLEGIVVKQSNIFKKTKEESACKLRDTALLTWSSMITWAPTEQETDEGVAPAQAKVAKYIFEFSGFNQQPETSKRGKNRSIQASAPAVLSTDIVGAWVNILDSLSDDVAVKCAEPFIVNGQTADGNPGEDENDENDELHGVFSRDVAMDDAGEESGDEGAIETNVEIGEQDFQMNCGLVNKSVLDEVVLATKRLTRVASVLGKDFWPHIADLVDHFEHAMVDFGSVHEEADLTVWELLCQLATCASLKLDAEGESTREQVESVHNAILNIFLTFLTPDSTIATIGNAVVWTDKLVESIGKHFRGTAARSLFDWMDNVAQLGVANYGMSLVHLKNTQDEMEKKDTEVVITETLDIPVTLADLMETAMEKTNDEIRSLVAAKIVTMYEMLKEDDTVMTDHLAPYVVSYLILSLDVYFEFAPSGTTKENLIKESIGLFIEHSKHLDRPYLGDAIYGLGLMAQHHKPSVVDRLGEIWSSFKLVLDASNQNANNSFGYAVDQACSAIGKYLVQIKDEFEKVASIEEAFAKFVDSLPFRMHVDDTPKAAVDFVALVSQPQFRALVDDDTLKAKVKALTEVPDVKKSPGLVDRLNALIANL